jgi:3-oxoacyl-[acyl-carrier-protein] synthase-1
MIGEGAAVFLMQREEAEIALLGSGTASDAYSMTAPEPQGRGVAQAIQDALSDAGLAPGAIDYIHLHGTGTRQNDEVEGKVIQRVFGTDVPCSSSKGQLGHTLGAAGAMGAAHCWLGLSGLNTDRLLPPHVWDGAADEDLLAGCLVAPGRKREPLAAGVFLCNAIAFGGNNVSLIVART